MTRKYLFWVAVFFAAGFVAALPAHAAVPVLSLETASGDSVKVTVQGDANSGVTFRYNIGSPAGELMTALGETNASGTLIATISSAAYAINNRSQVYVVVNSQQSGTQAWPYGGSPVGSTTTVTTGQAVAPIAFGSASSTISVGQTLKVALLGGTGKYTISNSPNPNLVQTTIGENMLVLTALGAGSTFVTVCDATNTNRCSTFFFSIVNEPAPVSAPTPAPATAPIPAVSAPVPASTPAVPVSTPVSTVTAPVVPTVPAVSNSDILAEIRTMQTRLAQILAEIQTMNAKIQALVSKIAPAAPSGSAVSSAAPVSGTPQYKFLSELKIGSGGDAVLALQNRLTLESFYSDEITGFYGSLTKQGVLRYQKAKGLAQTGIVDANTRAALNKE